jgi:hypothetical protein
MSIEERLSTALTGYAGLAALIGDRVYPVQIPQEPTLPAVGYLRVSTMPVQRRDANPPTYTRARFQLDGWAGDFDAMIALRKQIRAAMGAFVLATVPRVDVALLAGDRDFYEEDTLRWRCTLDYMIYFQED